MYVNWILSKYRNGGAAMKLAICDFDERYVNSLFTYLYGKCDSNNFSSFTSVEDFEASLLNNEYNYIIMGDEFYEVLKASREDTGIKDTRSGKIIILSSSIDNLQNEESYQVVYKYGPMDGLYKMINHTKRKARESKSYAVYSPTHHELTEMYGLSMCQMLLESSNVLLVDMSSCPVIRSMIRDGPRSGIVDVIYKLENNRTWEIKDLIEEYSGIDVLPMSLSPTDVASICKSQWKKLIEYIDSLKYETYVFIIEDISQGFKEIVEYVDNVILINRKGDYYKVKQDEMEKFIKNMGTKVTSVELQMSANNLNEGCYRLEELLSGNLGRYVRNQKY